MDKSANKTEPGWGEKVRQCLSSTYDCFPFFKITQSLRNKPFLTKIKAQNEIQLQFHYN